MEQKEEQLNQNTTDIAVLKEQIGTIKDDIGEIKTNHLVHIADDIKTILLNQQDHTQKIVEFELAKKLIFGAVGLILISAMGSLTFTIFK